MHIQAHYFLVIFIILILTACGGGGGPELPSSGGPPPGPPPVVLSGQFIDSSVANIGYRTNTQSGTTNSQGEFSYVEGEYITFFIGNLEFPTILAKPIITPLDLAVSTDLRNNRVVNISRLLQSLDLDGTPSNGITIPSSASPFASAVNFSLSEAAFAALPEVTMLVANSGSTNISLITPDEAVSHLAETLGISFVVNPFSAEYYDSMGLVASETVAKPSIIYAWSDFHNIDSEEFSASWTGTIEVFNQPQQIDFNFDVSWSDVVFTLDGVEISSWSNSNMSFLQDLSVGIHDITVDYANNWHTTGFNVAFKNNPIYNKTESIPHITPLIDTDTQVIYVGANESGNLYNNITITLNNTEDKVFLFVSSGDSVNWVIENPYNVEITGIAHGSSGGGRSTIITSESIPEIEISNITYGYSDFSNPIADITEITGSAPDATHGQYRLTQVTL